MNIKPISDFFRKTIIRIKLENRIYLLKLEEINADVECDIKQTIHDSSLLFEEKCVRLSESYFKHIAKTELYKNISAFVSETNILMNHIVDEFSSRISRDKYIKFFYKEKESKINNIEST